MQVNNINPLTYLAISLCAFLSSCKTDREVSLSHINEIVRGQTTSSEIISMFGPPFRRLPAMGYRPEVWMYSFYRPDGFEATLVITFVNEAVSNYVYNAPYGQRAIAANPGYSPPAVTTDDGNQGSHVDEAVPSTDQQNSNAALALIAAPFVIEGLADAGIIEGLADIAAAVGEAAVNAEIANIIEEKVKTTFPDAPPDTQRLLTSVMQSVCTGHPSIRDIAGNFTQSEFNEWVAQRSPQAAKNVHLLETLYEVYKRVHSP
jgi:hypothetical protein